MLLVHFRCGFFFFKQKTAYEMRISDWSSDVCSSDLSEIPTRRGAVDGDIAAIHRAVLAVAAEIEGGIDAGRLAHGVEIPGQAQDADSPVGTRYAECELPGLPFGARHRRLQRGPPHHNGGIDR